jgi:hypothetical protein
VHGAAMANSDFKPWNEGTVRVLGNAERTRHFSGSKLFSVQTREGDSLVLKCFVDLSSFEIEHAAYRTMFGQFAAVDHFFGVTKFGGRPTLILRRLFPLDMAREGWESLFIRTLEVRRDLATLSARVATYGGQFPTVDACALLDPLRRWIRAGNKVPRAVYDWTMGSIKLPLELCHGDFHPTNILRNANGRLQLIDWERCSWSPYERDLAAIVVGTALRQPTERFRFIANLARPQSREPLFYTYLIMSEIIALLDTFADDVDKTDALASMLATAIKMTG